MRLLPGWDERIAEKKAATESASDTHVIPKSPHFYARGVTYVNKIDAAHDLVEFAQQRPLSHIGIDTEFGYDRPGLLINRNTTVYDPRSIHPLLLSLALAEPTDGERGVLYLFVVDLRRTELLPLIQDLLRLPICFVGHNLKVELFCLWQLGLIEPNNLWDTFIAEKARYLGRNNHRYRVKRSADPADQARAKEEKRDQDDFGLSLAVTCQRYGVPHTFEVAKSRLQQSFLTHGDNDAFTQEQINYAAEDARTAAQLYLLQTTQIILQQHLITIEMPWVCTNARMIWHGIKVDLDKGQRLKMAATHRAHVIEEQLAVMGLANVNSHLQLKRFFNKEGILEKFKKDGKYCFDKHQIKLLADLHPAIDLIGQLRKTQDYLSDKLLEEGFRGTDGRLHPDYAQLGADTGRQTSRHPNVLGLSRVQRPLVIPVPGYGLGEVDLSQIEPGIAGAVYGDKHLIKLFNTGDVYSAMAQVFFKDELGEEAITLPSKEFKTQYPDQRKQMKVCTLGIIYGLTAHGLANQLNISTPRARQLQARFMSLFPLLQTNLPAASAFGAIRGYASTATGLRRYRKQQGSASSWESNWLKNHPVQGTAAALFKMAGNRLDRLYMAYGAKLIIPLHDSFVFEAPLDQLEDVAQLTKRVMCQTIQEFFPQLQPRVDINIRHPERWNKEGDVNALDQWIMAAGSAKTP